MADQCIGAWKATVQTITNATAGRVVQRHGKYKFIAHVTTEIDAFLDQRMSASGALSKNS